MDELIRTSEGYIQQKKPRIQAQLPAVGDLLHAVDSQATSFVPLQQAPPRLMGGGSSPFAPEQALLSMMSPSMHTVSVPPPSFVQNSIESQRKRSYDYSESIQSGSLTDPTYRTWSSSPRISCHPNFIDNRSHPDSINPSPTMGISNAYQEFVPLKRRDFEICHSEPKFPQEPSYTALSTSREQPIKGSFLTQPVGWQVANYNIHPAPTVIFESEFASTEPIRVAVVESTSLAELPNAFQNEPGNIYIKEGSKVITLSGYKLSKKGPIKTDLQAAGIHKSEVKYKLMMMVRNTPIYSSEFRIVSSCSQLPPDIRKEVRPSRSPGVVSSGPLDNFEEPSSPDSDIRIPSPTTPRANTPRNAIDRTSSTESLTTPQFLPGTPSSTYFLPFTAPDPRFPMELQGLKYSMDQYILSGMVEESAQAAADLAMRHKSIIIARQSLHNFHSQQFPT